MLTLGIESSTNLVSLGISQNQEILGELRFQGARREVGRLIPWIDYLLKETGKELKDFSAISCVSGPGSFSGLRISLATVQGLSLSLKIPVVEFCSLDALAQGNLYPQVCVALHSQAENYFFAFYKLGERQGEVALGSVAEIIEKLTDNSCLASPTISHFQQIAKSTNQNKNIFFIPIRTSGGSVAQLGELAFQQGKIVEAVNLSPKYLRGSFAERKKNESRSHSGN